MAERGARLERDAGHPADVEIHLDHMIGAGKGLVGRLAVAEHGVDEDIVPHLVPDDVGAPGLAIRNLLK